MINHYIKPYLESKLSSFYLKNQLKQFLSKLDSLHDIVLDLHSSPLFDTVKEDKKEIIKISSIKDIKEDILSITYNSSDKNENISTLYSFFLIGKENIYLLPKDKAKEDIEFNNYLISDKERENSI